MMPAFNDEHKFNGLPGNIPALQELMSRRQWVSWRYAERDGNITKPPINPHNGYGASHSDPATWGTYEQAAKWAMDHGLPGVGYVLTEDDDYSGGDLDGCREVGFGSLQDWAHEIISYGETYAEVSPSGEGVRLIWRGKVAQTFKCVPMSVEVYREKRYLTITGDHIPGTPKTICAAPKTEAALRERVESYRPAPPTIPPSTNPPPKKGGAIATALLKNSGGSAFFRTTNSLALQKLSQWVPDLFGTMAEFQNGTGAWRISSKNLGRNLQEDLSIAPNGIVDFGVWDMGDPSLGKRTPIDIVLEFGTQDTATAVTAAQWLCGRMGVAPAAIGWEGGAEPTGPRASEPPPKPAEDAQAAVPPSLLIPLQSAFPISKNSIPPRDWIVPGLLLKRHLTVLVAPPGSGKSLLTLQVAMACSIGLAWGGWTSRRPVKVLVVNAEDDMDEMKRRLLAAAQEMQMDQEQLIDRVLLADAPETIVIARTDGRSKTVIRTPLLEQLVETIKANDVECVIVDPFAETFEGDENSNSEVKWAGILWREVGRRTGAAVFLVHHTKKYASGMAGDADASRGGGALIGTARILSTLFAMTEDEAQALNVLPEDRTKYVRFDDAKANLSLVSGKAKWFEKRTVPLDNGVDLIPGDDVGVLVPWSPPGVLDGISISTINLVFETIDRGLLDDDGMATGQFYTLSANGKERWAGKVVGAQFGCDDDKARRVLKIWADNGIFQEFEYDDPVGRKPRKGVKSIPAKRPGSPT